MHSFFQDRFSLLHPNFWAGNKNFLDWKHTCRLQLFADSFRDHVQVKCASHTPIIHALWLHGVYLNYNKHRENDAAAACMWGLNRLLILNTLPRYCSELLIPYKYYLSYMHEYRSRQHHVVTTLLSWFLVSYVGKDSSRIVYLALPDLGQIQKIVDCSGDSGTVEAYGKGLRGKTLPVPKTNNSLFTHRYTQSHERRVVATCGHLQVTT